MTWLRAIVLAAVLVAGCSPKATAPPAEVVPPTPSQQAEAPAQAAEIEDLLRFNHILIPRSFEHEILPSVGRIEGRNGLIGGGTYIGERRVVTAAHVVAGTGAAWFVVDGRRFRITQVHIHPQYEIARACARYDVAVLFLDEEPGIVPMALNRSLGFVQGDPMTICGFSVDIKKISRFGVFEYYGTLEEFPEVFVAVPHRTTMLLGDSGGAVLNGDGELAGIVSTRKKRDDRFYENGFVRVDRIAAWIDGVCETP